MDFAQLKEELKQVLSEDISNRNSIQDLRRNIFLSSESSIKDKELIREKEVFIESLQNDLKEADSSKSNLQLEIENILQEKENLEASILQLKHDHEKEIVGLKNYLQEEKDSELTILNEKIEFLQNEKSSLAVELNDKNLFFGSQIEDFKKQVIDFEIVKQKLKDLEVENLNLKNELLQADENFNQTVNLLKNENNELSLKLASAFQNATESELILAERNRLEIEVNELIDDLELQSAKFNELVAILEVEKQNGTQLASELKNLKLELTESIQYKLMLESELETMNQKFDLQQEQLQQSNLLLSSQNLELSKSFESIHNKSNTITDLEAKLLESEKIQSELNEKINSFQSSDSNNDQLHSDFEKELTRLRSILSEKEVKIDSLSCQLTDKFNEVQSYQSEISELNNKLENLNQLSSELDRAASRTDSLEKDIRDKEEIINELNSSLLKMTDEINSSGQTNLSFTEHNDEFIEKLFAQINILNDEKLILVTERDELLFEMKQLREKLDSFCENIEKQYVTPINLEFLNKNDTLADESEMQDSLKLEMRLRIQELVEEVDGCIHLLTKNDL